MPIKRRPEAKAEFTFIPNPMQRQFIESRATADLFSSRMGEGKSAALCWSIFYHTRHNPGARWVMIRDTWENLQATTMKEFFKWFPPGLFGEFKQTTKTFTWTLDGMDNGEVMFLGMDDPADATKLQSREMAGFAIDEPAPAVSSGGVDELVFDIALSRLRQPGMNWYAAKLAENNPDEAHWTYRRFVDPGTEHFTVWQPIVAENEKNLPPDYYQKLRGLWSHRPDLQRRFIDGKFGFQQTGRAVTPEWSDELHLAIGLAPVRGRPLSLLWDFGHNPTCLVTQVTPLGHWQFLDALVGEDIGVYELIRDAVKPLLADKYRGFSWTHIGDPAGTQREQTSIKQSPVQVIKSSLGGKWISGPQRPTSARVDPLRECLRKTRNGTGLIRVDRANAAAIWHALRGGWHYHVARSGLVSGEPVKNMHSHPGDAAGYGAAVLFPLGQMQGAKRGEIQTETATFFRKGILGFERPGFHVPREAERIAG